ncbi:MAG TPA: hypothetical protein VF549_03725 [Solirubrobacteraceae bacterium]|jgi:hypothetical protein
MSSWLDYLVSALAVAAVVPGNPASDPRCPRHARPLPPDAVAQSRALALREVRRLRGREQARGARVVAAAPATRAPRGGPVRHDCGGKVQRRTVVVDLVLPALLPSASLSQTTFAISITRRGRYRVWELLH